VKAAGTEASEEETETEVVVDEVVVEGWIDKLWILHPRELETIEQVRDGRRQAIRRALVCQKDELVQGIRECCIDEAAKKKGQVADSAGGRDTAAGGRDTAAGGRDTAAGGRDTAAGVGGSSVRKTGVAGIPDAIVTACQREGVVCSLQVCWRMLTYADVC
jgi:hypothetical protein